MHTQHFQHMQFHIPPLPSLHLPFPPSNSPSLSPTPLSSLHLPFPLSTSPSPPPPPPSSLCLLHHSFSVQINYEADSSHRHILPSDSESLDCLDGPSPEPGNDRRESSVSLSGSVNSEDILCQRSHERHSTVTRPFSDPSIPDSLKMEEGVWMCGCA